MLFIFKLIVILAIAPSLGWALPTCKGSPTTNGIFVNNWHNCKGTNKTENSIYVGGWQNGKASGRGTFIDYKNGFTYKGQFFNAQLNGFFLVTNTSNGKLVHEGYYKNGKMHGDGINYSADGNNKFIGEFRNAKFYKGIIKKKTEKMLKEYLRPINQEPVFNTESEN